MGWDSAHFCRVTYTVCPPSCKILAGQGERRARKRMGLSAAPSGKGMKNQADLLEFPSASGFPLLERSYFMGCPWDGICPIEPAAWTSISTVTCPAFSKVRTRGKC